VALRVYEHLVVGLLQCNCYLVGDPETSDAIVVDPGDDPDAILAAAERHGLRLGAAVATHAHFDHVLAAQALRERAGIPFWVHGDDLDILSQQQEAGRWFLGIELPPPPEVDRRLTDGDEAAAGSLRLEVVHTPGHSPGSISLVAPDEAVFSGDTLFAGSIGRTDLPGADYNTLIRSIKDVLFEFGDEAVVHPGHGPETTIGRERTTNPFLR
jgi:hydroxyacylglutathione hydrolase